jgi:hypothetical protein
MVIVTIEDHASLEMMDRVGAGKARSRCERAVTLSTRSFGGST